LNKMVYFPTTLRGEKETPPFMSNKTNLPEAN